MTVMSAVEATFCRSAPWRGFARHVVLPWALRGVEPDGDGLEIGGGSGAMAFELLRRRPDVRLTVTDLDPAMAAAARHRLAPCGDRARVHVADAAELPFATDSFDFACSWLMLHHTIRWEAVVAELVRVVRPGGVVVGYDLSASGVAGLVHRADGSDHRLVRPAELRAELERLAVIDVHVAPALAGQVMRFRAVRG